LNVADIVAGTLNTSSDHHAAYQHALLALFVKA